MFITPLVQRETGRVVAYRAAYRGQDICFGRTQLEAIANALRIIVQGGLVPVAVPVRCQCD